MNKNTQEQIYQMIGEAIGQASMCWVTTPKGVFDSTLAKQVTDELFKSIVYTIEQSNKETN